jgi:TolA-binding protein
MIKLRIARVLLWCASFIALSLTAAAQGPAAPALDSNSGDPPAKTEVKTRTDSRSEMEEVQRQLREQQQELERMRAIVVQQSGLIESLRQRVEQTEQRAAQAGVINTGAIAVSDTTARVANSGADSTASATTGQKPQTGETTDVRLARVEEQAKRTSETLAKQLGSINFSGDLRLQFETFLNQLNNSANGADPTIVGNPLSARNRFRLRARLAIRGAISKELDWGLRLATGSLDDVISQNHILTDFYNRKQFALDQAYLAWSPRRVPGLRLQGGKFDAPWMRTEMTFDNDVMPEGLSQTYSRNFKNSAFRNLTLVAWELPFLERTSAFVRNANGTVNLDQSRRNGRDLALYGAQVRARIEPSKKVALTLTAADHFYSGTQFITPIQFFGNQFQIPITITIPATASTPAQTVTATATITRDLLVSGNGNLGLSTASNNATNRDGRLASGFNLADFIARLDLSHSKRFPVSLLLNFVTNTQVHDVVTAGPGGRDLILPNHENKGYWAEIQVGKARERGDLQLGYTFIRIEKDAVLTPFNFSELAQQSDVRGQRINFSYTTDPRVTLSFTTFITQRANGLNGVFGANPPGSLNRPTYRLQFDTLFRF